MLLPLEVQLAERLDQGGDAVLDRRDLVDRRAPLALPIVLLVRPAGLFGKAT